MKVFISTDFTGHYPVGTSAVVFAETEEQAAQYLRGAIANQGLPSSDFTVRELIATHPRAVILNNGDY